MSTILGLLFAVVKGVVSAVLRRLFRGPTLPSWSFPFEIAVAAQRALVSRMARLRGSDLRRISAGGMKPSPAVAALPFERVSEPVRGAWIRPSGGSDVGVVLFLHGGGYVVGSIESHRDLAGRLALAGGFDVFMLDYRLAPEHPYPAALDDAVAAYRWLLDSGRAPQRIAVAGDSAGGGLTLALLVSLREAGLPLPAAGGLISPWADLACGRPSITANAHSDYVSADALRAWARDYAAGAPLDTPTLSPIHADLAGLPPLMIQVGEAEILRDDGVGVASRAEKAGVEVVLEREPEMPHDWHMLARLDERGERATQTLAAFLRERLAPGGARA